MSKNFLNSLLWRRALKKFDPTSKNNININPILEAAQLAPSSMGLTPYNIRVITDQSLKEKLSPVSYNQPQVTLCSHLLVFIARSNGSAAVEHFIKLHETEKKDPSFANLLRTTFSPMDDRKFLEFSSCQAHISLGFGLAAAAELGIGSCPMGGFLPEEVKKVLELENDELPVAYLAVGNIPENYSEAAPFPKFRIPLEHLAKYNLNK